MNLRQYWPAGKLLVKTVLLLPAYLFIQFVAAMLWEIVFTIFSYDWLTRWNQVANLLENQTVSADAAKNLYHQIAWNQTVQQVSILPPDAIGPYPAFELMGPLMIVGIALILLAFALLFVRAHTRGENLTAQTGWFVDTCDGLVETSIRGLAMLVLFMFIWGFISLALLFAPPEWEPLVLILGLVCSFPPALGIARRELAPVLKRTLTDLQDW